MNDDKKKLLQRTLIPLIVVPIVFLLHRPEKVEPPFDRTIRTPVYMVGNPKLIDNPEQAKKMLEQLDDGMRAFQSGDMETAQKFFEDKIEKNPNDHGAHYMLGAILIKRKKYQQAERALNTAVSINPDFEASYLSLGYIALATGNHDKAIQLYEKAVTMKQNFGPAYWGLGVTYYQLGDCDSAKQNLQQVIKLLPGFPQAENAKQLISNCDNQSLIQDK